MIVFGVISEVKGNKAKIKIADNLSTDFVDVFQPSANSHSVSFKPLKVGEQGMLLSNEGDLNSGAFIRGIYQDKYKLNSSDTKEYVEFSDGTSISYDTKTSTLNVNVTKRVIINCVDCNVTCTNLNANANTTTIKSPSINLIGNTNIQGGISTSSAGGGAGTFSINGSLNISGTLSVNGNISTNASVIDNRGNLTNHTNAGYGRD